MVVVVVVVVVAVELSIRKQMLSQATWKKSPVMMSCSPPKGPEEPRTALHTSARAWKNSADIMDTSSMINTCFAGQRRRIGDTR